MNPDILRDWVATILAKFSDAITDPTDPLLTQHRQETP